MDTIDGHYTYTAIDLFCGCGGVTEGLKQAGFTVIAAIDNDPICCETYRLNHPEVHLLEKVICKTSSRSRMTEDAEMSFFRGCFYLAIKN